MPSALGCVSYRDTRRQERAVGEGTVEGGRKERRDLHHGGAHVARRYNPVPLPLHRLREKAEGLPDLALLLRRDVVLFRELRQPRLRSLRG